MIKNNLIKFLPILIVFLTLSLFSISTLNREVNSSRIYMNNDVTIDSTDTANIINRLNELKSKINGAGGGFTVLKSGTITATSTINLGEEIDPSKYMVRISTNSYTKNSGFIDTQNCQTVCTWGYGFGYGDGAYLSSKESTSCTITVSTGITAYYEIIKLN